MSAATDSRNASGLGAGMQYHELANSFNGPIAASVNLPTGVVAAKLTADTGASPVIYPFTLGASKTVLGVVDVGGDNSSGVRGAFPVRVHQRTAKFVDLNAGGANAIVATDVNKVAYCVDNQTWSKLPTDGEAGGMITGVDSDGGPIIGVGPMFLALARAWSNGNFPLGLPVTFPVALSTATSGAVVARILPGFAGLIRRLELQVITAPIISLKLATFQPAISSSAVSGGVLATTSTGLNTVGARQASTAVSALNSFSASQEIEILVTSATTYVEGQVLLQLFLGPPA